MERAVRMRVVGALVLFAAIMILVVVAVVGALAQNSGHQSGKLKESLRKAGIPLRLKEARTLYPPPKDSDNAALDYLAAQSALSNVDGIDRLLRQSNSSVRNNSEFQYPADFESKLKQLKPAFDAIDRAVSKPQVYWDRGQSPLYRIDREANAMRLVHGLVVLRARYLIHIGKTADALRNLETSTRILLHLRQDEAPAFSSFAMSLEAANNRTLIWLIGRYPDDPDILEAARKITRSMQEMAYHQKQFDFGVATSFDVLDEIAKNPKAFSSQSSPFGIGDVPFQLLTIKAFRDAVELRLLEFWHTVYEGRTQAESDAGPYAESYQKAAEDLDEERSWTSYITQFMVVNTGRTGEYWRAVQARRRITEATYEAIAALQSEGELPEKILVTGERGLDPFTKLPLKLRRTENEYLIYSVGFNRQDDGGLQGRNWEEGDIVARIPLQAVP
jgi:hypothetical protein